jgi:DNA-directed RNA polymerase subunit M/transcription elongation factor TFIIS
MPALADTARFRADDPAALVAASLACPFCLHDEGIEWHLEDDDYDPSVTCHCPRCEEDWRVYLAPDQELRLGLMAATH